MADVIYVNEEDGKRRVMYNVKLYTKLLTKFKDDVNINDLVAFADAQDWDKAQAAVHTIKGLAANLSLTELFNQSLKVETQIKEKNFTPESMESLKNCFAETLVHVEKVIVQNA